MDGACVYCVWVYHEWSGNTRVCGGDNVDTDMKDKGCGRWFHCGIDCHFCKRQHTHRDARDIISAETCFLVVGCHRGSWHETMISDAGDISSDQDPYRQKQSTSDSDNVTLL